MPRGPPVPSREDPDGPFPAEIAQRRHPAIQKRATARGLESRDADPSRETIAIESYWYKSRQHTDERPGAGIQIGAGDRLAFLKGALVRAPRDRIARLIQIPGRQTVCALRVILRPAVTGGRVESKRNRPNSSHH